MKSTLKHPFPDEPFGFNAFGVLFGDAALRKKGDCAQKYLGTDERGEAILEPINRELVAEMYKLCAQHTGATVDEVKAFLRDPK